MRILITDRGGLLGRRLVEALGKEHTVTVLDGDPRDRETAARATEGVDAVVCALPPIDAADPLPALDRASRGVYNLITTTKAGRRFVLLSSLRPFERYPLDHRVTEYWAPRPTTEPADLVAVLAEAVVREAAHTLQLKAVCVRSGPIIDGSAAPDPRAIHVDDLVRGVDLALGFAPPPPAEAFGWWTFHLVGAGRTR